MSSHGMRQKAPGSNVGETCFCELEGLAKLQAAPEMQAPSPGHAIPDCNIVYLLGRHRPELGENVYLHHSSQVIGNVRVGAGANVWCNAVVRGDNGAIHIGEGSNIQDNAVVHASPGQTVWIGDGASIGHGAIIHGCVVGDNCLIGNNATVMDGAVIQENTLVGASAIVSGRRTYEPGVLLVGNPARVRRRLADAEIEKLRINALRYVEQAARYRQSLRKILERR